MQNCPENESFFGMSFLSQKSESTFLSQKSENIFLSQKSENTFLSQKTTFLVQKSFGQIMDSFTSVLIFLDFKTK